MIRRRRRAEDSPAGGEDSFLDVVANLVGIFVILIMVLGVRAQDAYVDSAVAPANSVPAEQLAQRDRVRSEKGSLERSVFEVKEQADRLQGLAAQRQHEPQPLQVLALAAKQELDERRRALSEEDQRDLLAAAELRDLEAELATIEAQRASLAQDGDRPVELEHLPTPLARTVFGHEEHFRLKAGRLAYVPLNELTDMLKEELPRRIWRLKEVAQLTETLGPVQGFHLRYTVERRTVEGVTQAGPVVRQMAELQQFTLIPMSDQLGETVDEALVDGSQFQQLLETMRPGATVITVWTYPDSFGDFRQVKKWLFDRGFSTAARPLPADQPITGSPQGSRSASQ